MNARGGDSPGSPPEPPAPPPKDRLRIVSHFPGRLRVRAETFRVLPEVAREVAERVAGEPGVTGATSSPVTGSVLVTYDPRALQLPRLIHMLVRTGGLYGIEVEAANDWQHAPDDGTRVRQAFGKVNEAVRAATSGKIDMKVALPGTLVTTGIAMFLAGRRRVPEWYDLIFWAFVTFSNLNPRKDDAVSRAGDDDDGRVAE